MGREAGEGPGEKRIPLHLSPDISSQQLTRGFFWDSLAILQDSLRMAQRIHGTVQSSGEILGDSLKHLPCRQPSVASVALCFIALLLPLLPGVLFLLLSP